MLRRIRCLNLNPQADVMGSNSINGASFLFRYYSFLIDTMYTIVLCFDFTLTQQKSCSMYHVVCSNPSPIPLKFNLIFLIQMLALRLGYASVVFLNNLDSRRQEKVSNAQPSKGYSYQPTEIGEC